MRWARGSVGPGTPDEQIVATFGDVPITFMRRSWWRVELVRLPTIPGPVVRVWKWSHADTSAEPAPTGGVVLSHDVAGPVLELMQRALAEADQRETRPKPREETRT